MIRTTLLIGYKTLSEFAGKLFFFLIIIWAARNLSKEEFGIVSLAWALGWITSIATDFGLQIFLTRQISRCPSQAPIILKRLLRIRISLCGVLLLGGGAVMVFADWGRFSGPFLLIVGAQIVASLIDFFSHFYRGLSRAEIEASINLVYRGLTLTLVLLLSRALSPLLAVSYAMIVGAATGLAITWFLAFRLSRRISVEATDSRDGRLRISTADLFRTIAPIGAGILLSALYFRMDLFLIEYWKGSESVAVYNAVFRLIEALRLFPAAVLAVVFPYLCRSRNLRPLAATGMGLAVTGLLALAVGSWQGGSWLGLFYGESYGQGLGAFRILLWAVPLLFLNYALTHQLIGWERQRAYAWLCGGSLVTNLLLNWALIPSWGIVGAAWSTLGTELFLGGGCILVLMSEGPSQNLSEPLQLSWKGDVY